MHEAQRFISHIRYEAEACADELELIHVLSAECTRTTARINGVAVSGGGDQRRDGRMIRLAEAKERYAERHGRLLRDVAKAEKMIGRIKDERYRRLLRLRYLKARQWRDVAAALGRGGKPVPARTLYRWHHDAVIALIEAQEGHNQ